MIVPRASAEASDSSADRAHTLARRIAWADLLKRVFEVDALRCPGCGGRMRLISAITDESLASWIPESLALPSRAPPLVQATAIAPELQADDDSIAPLETRTDEGPRFEFDQTWDDDSLSNEDG